MKERMRNQGAGMVCKFIQSFQFLWVKNERLRLNACYICKYNNKSTKLYHILPKDSGTETAKVLCTKDITS
jgi:hypothetical protein